jgi:flagellar basal-body rod protein FlgB
MLEGVFDQGNYMLSRKMLDVTMLKHQAIASNLANIENPGYKRVQIESRFDDMLNAAVRSGSIERLNELQPKLEIDRNARSMRMDGNNVEMDHELLEMNRIEASYDFLTQYAGGYLKTLNAAITGRQSQ